MGQLVGGFQWVVWPVGGLATTVGGFVRCGYLGYVFLFFFFK